MTTESRAAIRSLGEVAAALRAGLALVQSKHPIKPEGIFRLVHAPLGVACRTATVRTFDEESLALAIGLLVQELGRGKVVTWCPPEDMFASESMILGVYRRHPLRFRVNFYLGFLRSALTISLGSAGMRKLRYVAGNAR